MRFGIYPSDIDDTIKAEDILAWIGHRCIFHPAKFEEVIRHRTRCGKRQRYSDLKQQPAHLEWLPDRGSTEGDIADKTRLFAWYRKEVEKVFQRWCDNTEASSMEKFWFHDENTKRHFVASPNSSFGYMYVGMWQLR